MSNFKKKCFDLNKYLSNSKLQFQTFGNVSIRINSDEFVIKPSGVNLNKTKFNDFPVVKINNGKYKGNLKPSVDTQTHLEIYKKFSKIKSIVHTHSKYAVIWSQALKEIPILGTTHADYSKHNILVTKKLTEREIKNNYQKNIAISIIKKIYEKKANILDLPGILVANHGPFAWGTNFDEAILNAERIEYIAELAFKTIQINKRASINKSLVKKHFTRKHGSSKYYGQ